MDEKDESIKRTIELPPDASDNNSEGIGPLESVSIRWKIRMKNTTAGTSLADDQQVKVLEILEKGLVLDVPGKTCSAGHFLAFEISGEGFPDLDFPLRATGKVESVKKFPDHRDQIQVKFIQYPEDPWDMIHRFLAQRQEEISKFLLAAGGRT